MDSGLGEMLAGLGIMLVFIGIVLFVCIGAMWKVMVKAGKPGWAAIVPIYNMMVLAEIGGKPNWWGLLTIIPFVGWIFAIIITADVAKSFGQGIGMTILMIFGIGWLILGFGGAQYVGPSGGGAPQQHV